MTDTPTEAEREEALSGAPEEPRCPTCGSWRSDSSCCEDDDEDVVPSWEEDYAAVRRMQGGW